MDGTETTFRSSEGFVRGDTMLAPEQVTVMMRLQQLGWGTKRIARELALLCHPFY
jgi:hypothetical protein